MGIINCENISFSYEKNKVIDDISFEINKNENVGIIGANGSGKTTLFKLILGIENVNKGIITIDDLEVKKANLSKIRSKMGYLFQDSDNQLFMNSVEDEVSFALYNYGMDENEECVKISKIGKTRKHTRWKRGEIVVVKSEKTK